MPQKHSFDLTDDIEKLWITYKNESDAAFTRMANNAIRAYLKDRLGKRQFTKL